MGDPAWGLLYYHTLRRGELPSGPAKKGWCCNLPGPLSTSLQPHWSEEHNGEDQGSLSLAWFWGRSEELLSTMSRVPKDCAQEAGPSCTNLLIDTLFEHKWMDVVGQLPKSVRAQEYILVVIDYATQYPETPSCQKMTSKAIVKELVVLFSCAGLPKESLMIKVPPLCPNEWQIFAGCCWWSRSVPLFISPDWPHSKRVII